MLVIIIFLGLSLGITKSRLGFLLITKDTKGPINKNIIPNTINECLQPMLSIDKTKSGVKKPPKAPPPITQLIALVL